MKQTSFLVRKNYLLFLIILLGFLIRGLYLRDVPPGPSLDEVSNGYNAFSILNTGKDEYGSLFPLLSRAYDDWRPALYIYTVIPFVKLLGLNIIAVRTSSVILSTLSIISVYFLIKALFKDYIQKERLSYLVTFLFTISPWHWYLSRLGHEANLAFALFILGITFFFYKKVFYSGFFLTLSFISYQSEKVFIPVIVVGLTGLFLNRLKGKKKEIALTILVCSLILTPFLIATLSPQALIRFKATNVFSANEERYTQQAKKLEKAVKENSFFGRVFFNRRFVSLQLIFEGYFSHFNPKWLFFNNGKENHKIPGTGVLYLWEFPFILLGVVKFFQVKIKKEVKLFILLWFLASPLSSAISTDAPHVMRSLTFLPTWQIFSSLGILFAFEMFRKYSRLLFLTLFLMVCFFFVRTLYFYFIVFPKEQSQSFQFALQESIKYVGSHEGQYKRVVFSNEGNLYQSYMFFLFLTQFDPQRYQILGGTKSGGFAQTHTISKYFFQPLSLILDHPSNRTLYIGNPSDFSYNQTALYKGKYLDGKTGVIIIER